jgi:hypothetical protein
LLGSGRRSRVSTRRRARCGTNRLAKRARRERSSRYLDPQVTVAFQYAMREDDRFP